MSKFTVAIWYAFIVPRIRYSYFAPIGICSGGGIAGLCLAAELLKNDDIVVDIFESSSSIEEIGANVTLHGRVCDVLRLMGLEKDCLGASANPTNGHPATTFHLRDSHDPDEDFGTLPFENALSLRRADLIRILRRRVPSRNIRLKKRLTKYIYSRSSRNPKSVTLEFSDGTQTTCDALIGCDGIRSVVRGQMMQAEASATGRIEYMRYIDPRWSGTIVYRSLIPTASLEAINPHHRLLLDGQIQHIIGHAASPSTLNIAVSITHPSREGARWPHASWSSQIDRKTCKRKIGQYFADWDGEAADIIDAIDSSIECAVMDVEPLPFYVRGCIALVGDAAHAAVPYIGANAAFAIEDAYALATILRSKNTTRRTLSLALEAYQNARRPYGNNLVANARRVLREFQYSGSYGSDTAKATDVIRRKFEESSAVGRSGPASDVEKAIFWMEVHGSG
ncbi:hypothetical protein BU17DRAFT_40692 [Hysterangium stoloniferum]|nr:hypothetical protein BU17DRAFT_40692 [Hysterangium stoloniferum]